MQVERVALDTLHADPANVREHNARNQAAIVASLQEYGQVEPLVVQAETRKVVGGNGRLEAMRAMGWTHCTVALVPLTNLQAAGLGIALNRTSELASWDDAGLKTLLHQLNADGANMAAVGYDQDELVRVLGEDPGNLAELAGLPEDDDAPDFDGALGDDAAPTSHVRMVQLFFNEEQYDTFMSLAQRLEETLTTDNITDTVLAVTQAYYNEHVLEG